MRPKYDITVTLSDLRVPSKPVTAARAVSEALRDANEIDAAQEFLFACMSTPEYMEIVRIAHTYVHLK